MYHITFEQHCTFLINAIIHVQDVYLVFIQYTLLIYIYMYVHTLCTLELFFLNKQES